MASWVATVTLAAAALAAAGASDGVSAATGAADGFSTALRPALVPWPGSIELASGTLAIGPGFGADLDGRCGPVVEQALDRFRARLSRQTGAPAPLAGAASGARLLVRCLGGQEERTPKLGMDESYTLSVTARGAVLEAAAPWGTLRGLETFLQLVAPGQSAEFEAPLLVIRDAPRFPWRGLLLDSGRHFMPVETVKRTLDGMSAMKLNVLHWHLTEDQGFRVESRRYPKLHRMGSDGLFYTQQQVRDVVGYAALRGIRVVPEFDMPGHTTSWFVGHPELATVPGPYAIERTWGIMKPAMDPTREEVYRLLDGFLGEMAALFPDPFLHIGGDEVEGHQWQASERVAAFKKQHGFADNRELQAYFNGRLAKILARHGKQMMGWDEILDPGLPKQTVIHSWRGAEGLGAAVKQGFRGVLSHGYYVDLMWPAARHYANDPYDEGVDRLSQVERERVLGGEAAMWAEYVDAETVDSRIWPRTAAIAERLWSPREVRDTGDMYRRLEAASRWLEWLGLDHRAGYSRMLRRLAGARAAELQQLADVVEPLKDYERGGTRAYTQQTPLNRLVDAARPESAAARELSALVDALLADPTRRAAREAVRDRLLVWQSLDARLRPLLEERELLREAVPLAAEVSDVAAAGLEALGFLEQGRPAPASWVAARAPLLEAARQQPSALEVAFRPAVQRLVRAAAGQ